MEDNGKSETDHRPGWPQNLVDSMKTGWSKATVDSSLIDGAAFYADRRRELAGAIQDCLLIVPAGEEKVRSNDTFYRFRASSDFVYLTGCQDPECVLIVGPGMWEDGVLYVPERRTAGEPGYYSDSQYGELWVGARMGSQEASARFGVKTAPKSQLMRDLLDAGSADKALIREVDEYLDLLIEPGPADFELESTLGEMRLTKDDHEIALLQEAIDSSIRGFSDIGRVLAGGGASDMALSERVIEGVFSLRARGEGNDVGYPTIAAAGPHATTLHWTRNDGVLEPGSLLLVDAGVEGNGLYTADITRTLPVGGKFSALQRRVYDIVLAAQRAGIEEVRPGARFRDIHLAASRVLAQGLFELGVLAEDSDVTMQEDRQDYRRYTLHGTSHMLGLDVHDCASARSEEYFGELRPGFVLTVEPGLYFQANDLTVPAELRGLGVRIEDDVLVTEDGCAVLSAGLPVDGDEIEAWMASFA